MTQGHPDRKSQLASQFSLNKRLKNIAKFGFFYTCAHQQLQSNPFALGSQNWNVPNIPVNQRFNSTYSNYFQLYKCVKSQILPEEGVKDDGDVPGSWFADKLGSATFN